MTWKAPLALFLSLRRADTAHEEVSGDTGANTDGDVVLDALIAPLLAVALLRVAASEEMLAKANGVETAAIAAERLVAEPQEAALPTARGAVTEFSRVYDRAEAAPPKANGCTSSADSTRRKRPLRRSLDGRDGPCEALGSLAAALWQSSLG